MQNSSIHIHLYATGHNFVDYSHTLFCDAVDYVLPHSKVERQAHQRDPQVGYLIPKTFQNFSMLALFIFCNKVILLLVVLIESCTHVSVESMTDLGSAVT